MLAGIVTRKPYVVVVHGMDVGLARKNPVKRLVARSVLRRAKTVVTNTMALEREVREAFGVERTVVVYPTVSQTPPNLPSPEGRELSVSPPDQSGGVRGGLCLVTVARLVPRKGHLRVLDAIARLREEHPDVSVSYAIVGDGPMRETIEARIHELNLANVRVMPNVTDDDLPAAYASADLLVMPVVRNDGDREGFGMVYLEAAAHCVPSVATDMPGVDEAVVDGSTGILVPDGDIAALADAVYGLATDPERRHALGGAARDRVRATFTPDVQFSKLKSIL